ncbi:hypothetical protein KFK09_019751 [Dendrobium nobile]|uniref:Uncharacterized protein n=1 Tax=Dendrobium nobile TaxID=94219 RepID=A0A8T3AXJ1_DENNO|nr:hypothetical protein KFK09_019751 [Dendrobium nobile]
MVVWFPVLGDFPMPWPIGSHGWLMVSCAGKNSRAFAPLVLAVGSSVPCWAARFCGSLLGSVDFFSQFFAAPFRICFVARDLVVCSHGILASRRDCVAFSAMVRSSFALGISSESATTSIDNPSCSGTFQRRDDMTVDSSTIHGRQSSRLLMDVDRKTDDSSTSQLSNKRKIADRIVFAGKKLPQRPTSRASNAADGGETRSKDRKDIKSLPKEKVMTSYQASLQNLRLPKGFVYVPVDSLQKDGSAAHDSESCERQEPGG